MKTNPTFRNLFRRAPRRSFLALSCAVAGLSVAVFSAFGGSHLPNPLNSPDPSGVLSTYSTAGGVDISNPFFKSMGTNGRTCGSCHVSSTAWTISPDEVQDRFRATGGTDPIFRPVDGANCPSADVSTEEARKRAYSQLLDKGLISAADFDAAKAEVLKKLIG